MAQPARFAQRSAALRDVRLSMGARVVFLLMDDEARGDSDLYIRQRRLAVLCGLAVRQLRTHLLQLQKFGYITVKRSMTGVSYVFHRQETADCDRQKIAARIGTKVPIAIQGTRATRNSSGDSPPYPPAEKTEDGNCGACAGGGVLQTIFRGQASNRRCGECGGSGRKESAA